MNYTNLFQIFGIDSVSPLTPYAGREPEAVTPEETKRFDRLSFDNLQLKEQKEKYNDLLQCNCPVCQEKTVANYIDEYRICENPREKNPVYKWSRLHEIFATKSEFELGRSFIRSHEFDHYLESKESARNFLSKLARRTQ